MNWKDNISGCFGSEDKKFAMHNSDRTNAQRVLSDALLSNTGKAEYFSAFEAWLKSQGCPQDHINQQMSHVKKLDSYFQYD